MYSKNNRINLEAEDPVNQLNYIGIAINLGSIIILNQNCISRYRYVYQARIACTY